MKSTSLVLPIVSTLLSRPTTADVANTSVVSDSNPHSRNLSSSIPSVNNTDRDHYDGMLGPSNNTLVTSIHTDNEIASSISVSGQKNSEEMRCASARAAMADACIGLDLDDSVEAWIQCNSAALNAGEECVDLYSDECMQNWSRLNDDCESISDTSNENEKQVIGEGCVQSSYNDLRECDLGVGESETAGLWDRFQSGVKENLVPIAALTAVGAVACIVYRSIPDMRFNLAMARQARLAAQEMELTQQRVGDLASKWGERANVENDEETGKAISEQRIDDLKIKLQSLVVDRKLALDRLMEKFDACYQSLNVAEGDSTTASQREYANMVFRFIEYYVDDMDIQTAVVRAMPYVGVFYTEDRLTEERVNQILDLVKLKEGEFPEIQLWADRANSDTDTLFSISTGRVVALEGQFQDLSMEKRMKLGNLLKELDDHYQSLDSQDAEGLEARKQAYANSVYSLVEYYINDDSVQDALCTLLPADEYIGYQSHLTSQSIEKIFKLKEMKEGEFSELDLWSARANSDEDITEDRVADLSSNLQKLSMSSRIGFATLMAHLNNRYEGFGYQDAPMSEEEQGQFAKQVFRLAECFSESPEVREVVEEIISISGYMYSNGTFDLELLDRVLFLAKAYDKEMPISEAALDLDQRCPVTLCGVIEEDEEDIDKIQVVALYPSRTTLADPKLTEDAGSVDGTDEKGDYNVCDLWPFLKYYTKHGCSPTDRGKFPSDKMKLVSDEVVDSARRQSPRFRAEAEMDV